MQITYNEVEYYPDSKKGEREIVSSFDIVEGLIKCFVTTAQKQEHKSVRNFTRCGVRMSMAFGED